MAIVEEAKEMLEEAVEAVKEALKEEPIKNTTILIKGSNSTKLHQITMAE